MITCDDVGKKLLGSHALGMYVWAARPQCSLPRTGLLLFEHWFSFEKGRGGGGGVQRFFLFLAHFYFQPVDKTVITDVTLRPAPPPTQATVGGSPFGPFISVARGHSRE